MHGDCMGKPRGDLTITPCLFVASTRGPYVLQYVASAVRSRAVRTRGGKDFQIDATPTFFINGQMYKGAMSLEELEKAIDPLL